MADKLMYISNDEALNYSSVDYIQWLKRLDTQLDKPTKQNSLKVPKVPKANE